MNCVVPDWIATERAVAELAGMSEEVRAATPAPIRMEEVADAVVACIGDDRMAGRVTVLWRGESRRLLDPGQRDEAGSHGGGPFPDGHSGYKPWYGQDGIAVVIVDITWRA